MKNISFLFLVLLLVFGACRKDVDDHMIIIEEDPPIVLVETALRGVVVDEAGIPIANATVSVGNQELQSDSRGNFHFQHVEVKKSGTIIKAQNDGYFEGVSHSNFSASGSSFVEIRMMPKSDPVNIQSEDGGNFITNGGMEVAIPQNAIRNQNGSPYQGPVQVFSRWIDPTDENMGGIMPGALTATDEDGNPLVLASFGMMAIELETPSGEELELNPNAEVEVKMPIPPELVDEAPEEIPFWYFDLEEEQWLLSGSCKKNGGYYDCIITITGYWNCDIDLPAICLSGKVFNSDSTESAYLKVIVEDLTNNFIYWGYTDINGFFCGSVPQGAPLQLTIKDLCDNVVYSEEIGPFAEDFQLSDIYLDVVVEEFFINITGTVAHCVSNDVPSGHVAVSYPGKIRIFPYLSGGFDFDMALKCVEFPELRVRAYSAFQEMSTIEFLHSDFSDLDMGQEYMCEDLEDYFNLNVDGVDYWTSPTQFYLKDNSTTNWMVLEGLSGGGQFVLDLREYAGVGTYTQNAIFKVENEVNFPTYPILNTASPNINIEISEDDGTFIQGTISGTATDGNGMTRNITGDFKIRKAP